MNKFFKKIFLRKKRNFVFGDSHAQVFTYLNQTFLEKNTFNVLSVGGATAQGLANPRSKTNALNLFEQKILLSCKKTDNLFFFIGEVDCGFVIWYRSKKYEESISFQFDRSLNNYELFLKSLKDKGYRNIFIIETILPTIFDGFEGQIAHERREVKVSIKERTELTVKYNYALYKIAKKYNFGFIEIKDDIMDKKTGLIKETLLNEDKSNHHLSDFKFAPIIYNNMKHVLEKKK